MIRALLSKDLLLLKHYVAASLILTFASYLAASVLMIGAASNFEYLQDWSSRFFMVLQTGQHLGFFATGFCSALLAGSVLTLERADRSVEFLACLPPNRYQHLFSKLIVLLGTTFAMLSIHSIAVLGSILLLPYVRSITSASSSGQELPTLFLFLACVTSIIGGSLATSAWQKSNGVPILCGLLTPLFLILLLRKAEQLLDLPTPRDGQSLRLAWGLLVGGLFLSFCGCYWYVERTEP
jgi:hypothetical protein